MPSNVKRPRVRVRGGGDSDVRLLLPLKKMVRGGGGGIKVEVSTVYKKEIREKNSELLFQFVSIGHPVQCVCRRRRSKQCIGLAESVTMGSTLTPG